MTDLERALEHERAKVRWLCEQLERTNDGGYHSSDAGKTAEQWELLSELFLLMEEQRGAGWKE